MYTTLRTLLLFVCIYIYTKDEVVLAAVLQINKVHGCRGAPAGGSWLQMWHCCHQIGFIGVSATQMCRGVRHWDRRAVSLDILHLILV